MDMLLDFEFWSFFATARRLQRPRVHGRAMPSSSRLSLSLCSDVYICRLTESGEPERDTFTWNFIFRPQHCVKGVFGKVADSLEEGTEHKDEYMISENELQKIWEHSTAEENNEPSIISFIQGVLDYAGFPAVLKAHFVPIEGQQRPRTTILIKCLNRGTVKPMRSTV
ncbi:hypothetical protein Rs2_40269 [Raphanus sativus]|nr:hypothetical protein Rs2_40269 [Raphanus sativus]